MATIYSGGRSQSTRKEPTTMGNWSLTPANREHLFCNLQSRVQSHAVLVIGLYEVLGNPTTQLTEPSGPSVLDNLIDIYINTDSVVFKNIYI